MILICHCGILISLKHCAKLQHYMFNTLFDSILIRSSTVLYILQVWIHSFLKALDYSDLLAQLYTVCDATASSDLQYSHHYLHHHCR